MSLFILGMYGVWAPPVVTIASLSPLPQQEKMACPLARRGLKVGEKEGWLNPVTCIGVVLVTSFLAATRVLECPGSPLMASLSHFLPLLQDHVSSHHRIGHAHLAEMSLSKACKILQQENLSQGILWPVPFWGAPISAPRALSPVVRSGNSCLDSNMAVLSP